MKTELRAAGHLVNGAHVAVVEVWHDGVFIAAIYGAEGPGVRVVSKYLRNSREAIVIIADDPPALEVRLDP